MRRNILHVVGGMDRGGVETWLMHVLRNIDQKRFEIGFLVHKRGEGSYDREILALGGRIYRGGDPRHPLQYAARFAEIVQEHGPFDVIHSHVYWYTGYVLRVAQKAGIPVRIAHSHTTARRARWNVPRMLYQELMRAWILQYATKRIAVSRVSGQALYGRGIDFEVLHLGLDFRRFGGVGRREDAKRGLHIPVGRKVIGHVGRFSPVKNHKFLVDVFERVLVGGWDAHLLLIGDGPLLPAVREEAESRGLAGRCTFAGIQPDVAPFLAAMDVFVFPSLYEGLPLVTLESQAAAVPVIASTGVTEDIDVIPGLVEHIQLNEGAPAWASAVSQRLEQPDPERGDEAELLRKSRYSVGRCLEALERMYLPPQPADRVLANRGADMPRSYVPRSCA